MSPSIKEENQFLRRIYVLQEKSEILLKEASDETLDKVARGLMKMSSEWKMCNEFAEKAGISLLAYKEPTAVIIKNLVQTQKLIRKREHDPAVSQYLQPMWPLFDDLDKALVAVGYRPVLRPLAEALSGIYLNADRLLNPMPARLLITSPTTSVFSVSTPRGEIERIWVEQNIFSRQKKGMTIHIKFSVHNLVSVMCRAAAYFRFRTGQRLLDKNNSYRAADGQVAVGEEFIPRYQASVYNNFRLFLPYSELHLVTGKHPLQFCVSLYVPSTNTQIVTSNYFDFIYQR